jgi:hypothetical protein
MRVIFNFIAALSMVLASAVFFSTKSTAAEQVDIYTIEVPVKSQSQYFRNLAMREGLSEVLVRASGSDDVLANDYIRTNLTKANAFVQQFAFQKSDPRANINITDYPWTLRLVFQDMVIQKLLSDAGLPVWSSTRPVVLIWLAEENSQGRKIVELDSETAQIFLTESTRRAIPIQFPLMDSQDSSIVDFTDVWGRFSSPIQTASKRYQSKVIIFGRIYPDQGKWHADWQMLLENERSGWRSNADTIEQVSQQLFTELGRKLCEKYCLMSTNIVGNELLIRVSDLNNLIAAAGVEKYLMSLLPVRDVNLIELSGNQALFKLRLVSREQAVLEAIALDSALSALPNPPENSLEKRVYNYRWTP